LLEPTLLSLEVWGVRYIEMTRYSRNCQSDKS
jgi:hypothetical protein